MNLKFGKHFSYRELTQSDWAVRHRVANTPNQDEINNMEALVETVLDPIRDHLGEPYITNSCFRSTRVNRGIGGSSTSQHCKGEAHDGKPIGADANPQKMKDLFIWIVTESNLPYDQIIWEFGSWIHISHIDEKHNKNGKINRGMVLEAYKDNWNRTKYRSLTKEEVISRFSAG